MKPQLDNYDRLGVQYKYGDNKFANSAIDSLNLGLDMIMKEDVCSKGPVLVQRAMDSIPQTCTLAFNKLPPELANDKRFNAGVRGFFCNPDDTVNKPAVQQFLSDMNVSLCPY
jgi:hypothetical protein